VPQRVAGKREAGQQDHVDQEQPATKPKSQLTLRGERRDQVEPQERERDEREIQKVAMDVLKDERNDGLHRVSAMDRGLAHRATRRVAEVEPVVRLAVVVAGRPEPERDPQDQETGADERR
jgi:hypothetical protein